MCGALNLAKLTFSLAEALKKTNEFKDMGAKLHADSTTVLCLVNSAAVKYKPYVKNKVIKIQNLTPSTNWRYIPSEKIKLLIFFQKVIREKKLL